MRKNKLFLIFVYVVLMMCVYGIEVAPSTYNYRIDQGGIAQDVLLLNENDKSERIKISFIKYRNDKEEKSLGKWTTVYPKIVSINPGSRKTVKFSIEPPSELKKGEYRSLIFFEELEQRALDFSGGKVVVSTSPSSQINFMISLGVVVYGYVGDPNDLVVNGKIKKVKREGNKITGIIQNNGEITKPYTLIVTGKNSKGFEEKITELRTVVEGYSDPLKIELPKGFRANKIELKGYNGSLLETLNI